MHPNTVLVGAPSTSICISLILGPSLLLFDYWAGAEGTTNKQFGRRQEISIFKGVDPWVASWNVIFPEEVVILMSLLLESVELPLEERERMIKGVVRHDGNGQDDDTGS